MKLVFTSDCHGMLSSIDLPTGDVLVLAGDILPNFSRNNPTVETACQENALLELDRYLGTKGFKHVIMIAGNHDRVFEWNKKVRTLLKTITYLEDEEMTIDGIKFYGSPWQPEFFNWAFNLPRKGAALKAVWAKIPTDVDVLITHGPPWGILDQITPSRTSSGTRATEHLGCELLADKLTRLRPKIHVFGHIHGSYGQQKIGDTIYVNASLCNEAYEPVNTPHVVGIAT